ncbi:deoxynucleoside triphosphate triphosphohydrolase SAMHD1-like [Alosa sapidissima]|uniref:deoxynucleoside triphosphate triphosphohydrolase SAMHD1-like n=1 Tax=Alosa sapidissima TaxID=34773 RepID=UPI001C086C72|nr:deoxynucleoside triphosphate triphosphohydrolase SAMHD1-like [Alosa sapidissima]
MDTPFTMDTFRENLHQKGIGAEASYDIIHCLQRLWTIPKEPKVFNDPIHGHIEIPPLLVRIIDTPEFQRLRNIKQLSGTYMVFPGASHNRFEHSLGVAYLAGELVKTLQEKQPKLKITKRDVLCVQIAGLCHDLGHGPFSHLYDGLFMNLLKEQKDPEEKKERSKKWTHEVASVKMLEHLVVKNHLEGVFWLSDLGDFQDALDFIGRLIMGGPIKEGEKDFLFQIVANKENGVDVDKWDYFARDSYYLGIGTSFDHRRLLKFVRVCTAIEDGKKHICYREKEAGNLYNMFYTRHLLHCRAYQHPVKNIIDHMIAEAFVAANDHFDIKGSQESSGSQNPQKISTAMNDMEAYAKLTDSVFDQILQSDEPGLKQAKKILQRVTCRELYHFIGESPPYKLDTISKDKLVKDMVSEVQEKNPELEFSPQDIVVHVITANYGNNSEDPLTNVYFYNKMDKRKAKKKEMDSLLLPQTFGEQVFRLYCKKRASLDAVKTAWKEILKNIKNGNLEK